MTWKYFLTTLIAFGVVFAAQAQVDDDDDDEDYSMYDNLDFAGGGTKRFCSSKIKGLSPQKLISIGYDVQGAHTITAGAFDRGEGGAFFSEDARRVNLVHGARVAANVPLISKNSIIIQGGINHWSSSYVYDQPVESDAHALHRSLDQNGLKTTGINTTVFKPLDETNFVLFQASFDINGDYSYSRFQSPAFATYSAAALWGKRPSDNKQWAIGVSRTYRAGELNYIPIVMYNWTSISGKWGTELLLPARGHVRYSFNSRSMLFAGFELEGQSYRLNNNPNVAPDWGADFVELRRSELRFRMMYERSVYNFIWLSVQAGYRVNYLFDLDELADGREFYRGFFGTQEFLAMNGLTNPWYFNVSLNLVSP